MSFYALLTDFTGLLMSPTTEYKEKDKSSSPLSMGELIKMIDTCERENADGDPLEKGLVKPFAIASGLDFVSVHSAFYNELEQYYEYEKSKWASEAT